MLDGRFLYTTVKAKGKLGKYEFVALRTYDQNKKAFPSWSYWFTNKASGINETIGRWDEDTKTMTDSGLDADSRSWLEKTGVKVVFGVDGFNCARAPIKHLSCSIRSAYRLASPVRKLM